MVFFSCLPWACCVHIQYMNVVWMFGRLHFKMKCLNLKQEKISTNWVRKINLIQRENMFIFLTRWLIFFYCSKLKLFNFDSFSPQKVGSFLYIFSSALLHLWRSHSIMLQEIAYNSPLMLYNYPTGFNLLLACFL